MDRRCVWFLAALPGLASCEAAADLLESLFVDNDGPKGPRATEVLARSPQRPSKTDVRAVVGLLAAAEPAMELPADQVALLRRTNGARIKWKDEFVRQDAATAGDVSLAPPGPPPPPASSADLAGMDAGFVISTLARMPVRDQGRRGTCASFAGVGHLESFFLKKYPQLPAVDLAEQYFYYAAKKDRCLAGHDPRGCAPGREEGSTSEQGYRALIEAATFDLMGEDRCPYNPRKGASDIQYETVEPQCVGNTPVARVTAIDWVSSAQEILDHLREHDVAVVVYTKLSMNWSDRAGSMVTLAEAGALDPSEHGGGHAYLVVGARPIDLPGEGNMCFIVKNSWGAGWGREGMKCMTLAWFNEYRWRRPFPVVLDAELSPEFLRPFGPSPGPSPGPTPNPPPAPQPAPNPSPPQALTRFALEGDDGDWYVTELRASGASGLALRGILADGSPTNEIALERQGATLVWKDVGVGRLYADHLQLCTADFSEACQLSYFGPDRGGLAIEFLQYVQQSAALERDLAGSRDVRWQELSALSGATFGLQFTTVKQGLGVRLVDAAKAPLGSPLGLHLDVASGQLVTRGQPVGAIGSGGVDLCTGPFRGSCRIVVGGERALNLFAGR